MQTIYVGSAMVDKWLPGFRQANDPKVAERATVGELLASNQSRISGTLRLS